MNAVHSIASRCAGCTMPPTVELVPALPTQCCWALCFGPPQREVKGVSFPSSEVVEIPKLSEDDRAMKGREHQFAVDCRELLDSQKTTFTIRGTTDHEDRTALYEVKMAPGGMLEMGKAKQAPELFLRASSGEKRLVTLMDGRGSYFGKLVPKGRAVVLYYMQQPCACIIPRDTSSLSMQVYPLLDGIQNMLVASSIRKGNVLRIQVSANFDGCLFLGCLLGIILLEPSFMQLAG